MRMPPPHYSPSSSVDHPHLHERKQLRTYSLTPPDYLIDPQILLEHYIEKEVQFAGLVTDVSVDDVTNRTEILRIVDRGKMDGRILMSTTYDPDAVFSLSAQNIKITRRVGEDLLLRVPIHEIAAICYIRDDGQHILTLKHGDPEKSLDTCHIAVLYCDRKTAAEEICALVAQCFQLVYTEATMQFFDRELQTAANGASTYDSSTTRSDSSTITNRGRYNDQNPPAFITRSNPDLHSAHTSSMLHTIPRSHRTPSTASELSTPSTELLQDYMQKLHKKLTSDELRQFASLLKSRTSLPFEKFCNEILALFGHERKHLIAGLCPFIAEREYAYFETFLERHKIYLPESGISSVRSVYSRTLADTAPNVIANNGGFGAMSNEEFDRIMDNVISHDDEDDDGATLTGH